MNLLGIILIAVCVILFLLVLLSYSLAHFVVWPKYRSTQETIKLEEDRGFIRGFFDIQKEDISITCNDNYILNGNLIKSKNQESKKYVIISHGYKYTRIGSIKYFNLFYELGYNVIIYDNRGHGENTKTYCSMGIRESADLLSVIDYVYNRFGDDIYLGLHGESLGASLSIMALANKPKVKFLIADCGYAVLGDVLRDQISLQLHLPRFLVSTSGIVSKIIYGFNINKIKPIDALKNNTVPICFFHGKADTFTNYKNSVAMSELQNDFYRELHLFPNAEHAKSILSNEENYANMLKEFLHKIEVS